MSEVGGLGHHTKNAIMRKDVNWTTDQYGFRNNEHIPNPDMVFIGRSFIFGGALDQSEMLNVQVGQLTGLSTYNMSLGGMQEFLQHLEHGIISKPKWLVYGMVERQIPALKNVRQATVKNSPPRYSTSTLEALMPIDKILKANWQKFIASRFHGTEGIGIPSPNSDMLFFQGVNGILDTDPNKIAATADVVNSYKLICDSLGIHFIFLPIPNKETVYFENVPLDQRPEYIEHLELALQRRGVLLARATEALSKDSDELLYHLDDSHWNSRGVALVAKEIADLIVPDSTVYPK